MSIGSSHIFWTYCLHWGSIFFGFLLPPTMQFYGSPLHKSIFSFNYSLLFPPLSSSSSTLPLCIFSLPEQDISTCIKSRCKDFLKYTNWKLLLPHLLANELLDSDITDVLISNYQTNQEKGLKFYLSVLPSKGHTAYSRFYQCLLQEEEHSGHRTLLELLDNFNKT